MFYDLPCELEVSKLPGSRLSLCNTLVCSDRLCVDVSVLNQHTAVHADILLADSVVLRHIHLQNAEILLRAEKFESVRSE